MKKRLNILVTLMLAIAMLSVTLPVDAAESEHALFPMQTMNLSSGLHCYAIDLVGSGSSEAAFAPFSGTVVYKDTSYNMGNTVVLQSDREVYWPDGTFDYMTVGFTHDNNISDLSVGDHLNQGTIFYQQGNYGQVTGKHIHLNCAQGRYSGYMQYSAGYYRTGEERGAGWRLKNSVLPFDALWVAPGTAIWNNGSGNIVAVNWKGTPTFTVSYYANGGTGAPSAQNKAYGATLKLSNTVPTRSGYSFQGWDTSSLANTAIYAAGADYTANASATLYAVWKSTTHTHTYVTYGTWGGWSAWVPQSYASYVANDTCEVETATIYRYYYFVCPSDHRNTNWGVNCSECGKYIPESSWHELWSTSSHSSLTVSGQTVNGKRYTYAFDGRPWYFETTTDSSNSAAGNRYRDRSKTNSEWVVTKAATCIAVGMETRTCTSCGQNETRSIPAKGHTYGNWTVTEAATCIAAGTETRTCSTCAGKETRSIPAKGHTYGSWTVTKAATCTAAGTETRTCSTCTGKETRSVAATGHKWSAWIIIVAATVDSTGTQERTCSVCSARETQTLPKLPVVSATGIALDAGKATIGVGQKITRVATVSPANATNKAVTWSSSKTRVATVTGGVITAKSSGTTTVKALTHNGKSVSFTVTVKPAPKKVSLSKSVILGVGESFQTSVTITPSNAFNARTYYSDGSSIATVDANGLIVAKKVGTATISVKTYNGKTSAITVMVKQAPGSITLDKASVGIKKGKTLTLKLILPENSASYKKVWTTSNSKVAVVDKNGKVTAKGRGSCTITVTTFNGRTATCEIAVK